MHISILALSAILAPAIALPHAAVQPRGVCYQDNPYRALLHEADDAALFCPAFLSGCTPPLPDYIERFPVSRITSACSCFEAMRSDQAGCVAPTGSAGSSPSTAAASAPASAAPSTTAAAVGASKSASSSAAAASSSGSVTGSGLIAAVPTASGAAASSSKPATKPASVGGAASSSAMSLIATGPSSAAPSSAPSAAPSGGVTAKSGKRGLNYNNAQLANLFSGSQVTWAYNWASSTTGLSGALEFVPMLWSNKAGFTADWSKNAAAAIAKGSKHLLAFNEPDLGAQANMSPTDAAAAYKQYMQPFAGKASLGAPAVTNGGAPMGMAWLQSFLTACSGCQIDFVPIHWYDSATNVAYFKNYVTDAYTKGGKRPIWISEFAGSGSSDQQVAFLKEVIPWLDASPMVERYAYFGVFDGKMVNGNQLSPVGSAFNSYTAPAA